jgi:hypothetical protein
MPKTFVEVDAHFDLDGKITPTVIYWADGHKYIIDRVVNSQAGHSEKVGGIGMRYECELSTPNRTYTRILFRDENRRWFVE